jgi:hypothetical protein
MSAIHSNEQVLEIGALKVLDMIQIIKAFSMKDPTAHNW